MTTKLTLIELRDALAKAPADHGVMYDLPIRLFWGGLDSWRGIYAEPAIGYRTSDYDSKGRVTAARAVAELDAALNDATFEGYKGGTFRFRPSDPVHVDNHGEYTPYVYVERVEVTEYEVRLHLVTTEVE